MNFRNIDSKIHQNLNIVDQYTVKRETLVCILSYRKNKTNNYIKKN